MIFVVSTSLLLLIFVPKMIQKSRKLPPRQSHISFNTMSHLGRTTNISLVSIDDREPLSDRSDSSGMMIISPQFEIEDLRARNKKLRKENATLRSANERLDGLLKRACRSTFVGKGGDPGKSVAFAANASTSQNDTETEPSSVEEHAPLHVVR